MIEYVQCRKCLGKNGNAPKGYIIRKIPSGDGQHDVEVVEECSCHKAWRKAVRLEGAMKKAGIPQDVANYDINTYVGTKSLENISRLKKFVERSLSKEETMSVHDRLAASCLYLYGRNGTQKTTVAMWMGYKFLEAGKKVRYILMNDLLKMLQKSERDEDMRSQLDKLSDVDLLLIDESFDKGKLTIYKSGYQIPFLDSFLRNRIQTNSKGIIFISNVNIEEIESNGFNASIQDLVRRNVTLSKGFMEFEDNYMDNVGQVDIEDLF